MEEPPGLFEWLPLELLRIVVAEADKDGLSGLPISMVSRFANLHFPYDKYLRTDNYSLITACAERGYLSFWQWYSSTFFSASKINGQSTLPFFVLGQISLLIYLLIRFFIIIEIHWEAGVSVAVNNGHFDFYKALRDENRFPLDKQVIWSRLISRRPLCEVTRFANEFGDIKDIDTFAMIWRRSALSDLLYYGYRDTMEWLLEEKDALSKRLGFRVFTKDFKYFLEGMLSHVLQNKNVVGSNGSHIDIYKYLVEKIGFPVDSIWIAAGKGDVEVIKFMIQHGAQIFKTQAGNVYNYDSVLYATWAGSLESVKLLLDEGAYKSPDVVPAAAEKGRLELLKCLIQEYDFTYSKESLIASAMRADNEDLLEFVYRVIGCSLTPDCFSNTLLKGPSRDKVQRTWAWLKKNKCPYDWNVVRKALFTSSGDVFGFVCGEENIRLTDADLDALFYGGNNNEFACFNSVIIYVLTKLRRDYKIDLKFLSIAFSSFYLEKHFENLNMLRTIGYVFTRSTFVWLLNKFKFQSNVKHQNFLRNKVLMKILVGGYLNKEKVDDRLYDLIGSAVDDDMRREEAYDLLVRAGYKPTRALFKLDDPNVLFGNLF